MAVAYFVVDFSSPSRCQICFPTFTSPSAHFTLCHAILEARCLCYAGFFLRCVTRTFICEASGLRNSEDSYSFPA